MSDSPPNIAEKLADIAEEVSGSRLIIVEAGSDMDLGLARVKLAMDLNKHPVLLLRAIVEDWTPQRIVRELY